MNNKHNGALMEEEAICWDKMPAICWDKMPSPPAVAITWRQHVVQAGMHTPRTRGSKDF